MKDTNERRKSFTLTEDHIKLLRRAYVEWGDNAPCIDAKRPYGNSDVLKDVAEILGWPLTSTRSEPDGDLTEEQADEAARLHRQTAIALEVILRSGSFEPGRYSSDIYDANWRRDEESS